jgi:hypothetical protein
MTTEERITQLEANCKAMTAELKKLKAELAEKDKHETVWIPKSGEEYSYVRVDGNIIGRRYDDISKYDNLLISMNAVFKSTNSVEKHLEWYRDNILKVQNKLMQLHELLCPDYFPDWNNNIAKCFVYYNYYTKKYEYVYHCTMNIFTIYFTEDAAKKACEILNREKFMI